MYYTNDWAQHFPYSGWGKYNSSNRDAQWAAYLMDQSGLPRAIYACPSDPPDTLSKAVGYLTYSYNRFLDEPDGIWPDHEGPTVKIVNVQRPGTTILIGEALHITIGYSEIYSQPGSYGIVDLHDQGNNWAFVDGHVEWHEGIDFYWPYYYDAFDWRP